MLANHRQARAKATKGSKEPRRYSARASDRSKTSSYKDKAQRYYSSFGGKRHPQRAAHQEYSEARTPQNDGNNNLKKLTNFYLKNKELDEEAIKLKSLSYLDKKGILQDKINKRYYKDNDIANHLKVNQKQWLCHQMRIPNNQLRVRYPKWVHSLYTEDFEKKRKCIGGKTEVFNRDKEKKFFKADHIGMKTSKEIDFAGEQVPYERVTKKRPATSYGPFISSTSYGHTFQGWGNAGGYAPALVPRGNLQTTASMPFKACSAYKDTYKSVPASRPGSNVNKTGRANAGKSGSRKGSGQGAQHGKDNIDPNKIYGGKNRAQKSQISILSSPDKKLRFMNETTNRVEFANKSGNERSRPIKHPDNLGNLDLKVDPSVYNTQYRNNFNDYSKGGTCKREDERITLRKGLKQLQ